MRNNAGTVKISSIAIKNEKESRVIMREREGSSNVHPRRLRSEDFGEY
jgi:hypothetical protein